MVRSAHIRLYAALLALAATLLLAFVPAVGRVLSAGAGHVEADASRSDHGLATAAHAHRASGSMSTGGPAPLHSVEDCIYCVLLGSLARPALPAAELTVPRAPRASVSAPRATPGSARPLSTLGSRGPPRRAA